MKKTILIITDNLKDQINGVVTTFKSIEKYASADGYNIVYLDPGQFSYIDAPGYPEVKLSWPKQIGAKIRALSPDYVHIATEGPLGLAARFWLDSKGWCYNTSYHTKFPEFINKIYKIPVSWTYWYVRWFHKHSGRVLATTQTMVDELHSHGFKTNIVPWTRGVDRETLKPNRKHQPRTSSRPPVVLYAGRVSKEKNLDDLCRLENQYTIHIVGDGPDRARLEKTYRGVKFLGYKKGTDLANCYALADVFCFSSKTDTFGIVIIEALSVGLPVAAYEVPGPIDILEQGVTGYMGTNLDSNIDRCLKLDRATVRRASQKWTWEECWRIFKENLVEII
jgi:glycosyltransferase involved in cell wall biosynthesis